MPCQFCDIRQRTDHEHDTNKQHCPVAASGAAISIGIHAEQIGLPKPHEVLIRHEAIALNFVDLLLRNGSFPLRQLPAIIGVEAAGVIESVDSEVIGWAVGDRVGYYFSIEAYAQQRLIDPRQLVKLPDDINFDQAASLPAKRLTGRMLVKEAYPVQAGDIVLVHAATGAVGSLVSRYGRNPWAQRSSARWAAKPKKQSSSRTD